MNHRLIDMDNATSTQQCIWANGCTFKRYVLGQSGIWRGQPYQAPALGAPTFHSEAMSTDAGRPATFDGVACDTPSTGWPAQVKKQKSVFVKFLLNFPQFDGWMCSNAYEACNSKREFLLFFMSFFKKLGENTCPISSFGLEPMFLIMTILFTEYGTRSMSHRFGPITPRPRIYANRFYSRLQIGHFSFFG